MPTAAGRLILCVDNRASRNLAVFLLRRAGYEVRTAGSVADALKLISDTRFDLYLVNHQLLEGASAGAGARLRAITPNTPLLAYSTVTYPFRRRRAPRRGDQLTGVQPVSVTEVTEAAARALRQQAEHGAGGTAQVKGRWLSPGAKMLAGAGVGAAALLFGVLIRRRGVPRPHDRRIAT